MANITKSYIEKEVKASADRKQIFHFDDQIKGFGIRVTAGSKTFILDRKLNGKSIRITIGRFPTWSVQQARDRARELMVEMDKGNDIRVQIKQKENAGVTLRTVFERFLSERQLKPRTCLDYGRYLDHYLQDWLDHPVARIDSAMIMTRYKKIANSSSGQSQASSAMRCLRSILNFAIAAYGKDLLTENPVISLTAKRAWLRDRPKTDHLRSHEVKPFVRKLRTLPNTVMGAYLEFILMTGARRSEAATLKWKNIDHNARTLVFKDTKNHTDRTMPMTPYVTTLLESMQKRRMGEYVFWSRDKNDKPTHIKEPRKAMALANTSAESAVTVHGLRRTYCTFLESLDCPGYPLKALMGHSVKSDVTGAHYNQITVERLRPWAEKYEAFILNLVEDDSNLALSGSRLKKNKTA